MQGVFDLVGKRAVAARLGPVTATSIGVEEPMLMTRLTISLGSKEKLTSGNSAAKRARRRSLNGSMRSLLSGLNCACRTASSDPPFHR